MKVSKLINNRTDRLLLCVAGWSAVPGLFASPEAEAGQDVWVCYDYRDLSFAEDLSHYRTIDLVAWSMGVWVAEQVFAGLPLRSATAINGTGQPVDDTFGIPPAIFRGTLENVTDEGMARFDRRMCGSRELLATYQQHPARPAACLKEELLFLYNEINKREKKEMHWTRAFLSTRDMIFPIGNQRHYWQGRCTVIELDAPHYPFYLWKQWKEITG